MVRKINLTRGENLIKKPNSYARESYEKLNEYETVKQITSTKGITSCYDDECNSNNIIYDTHRDEVYCPECGLVLRQGFEDNQDIINGIGKYEPLKQETLSETYNNKIDYYQDLMKQTEIEVLGTI